MPCAHNYSLSGQTPIVLSSAVDCVAPPKKIGVCPEAVYSWILLAIALTTSTVVSYPAAAQDATDLQQLMETGSCLSCDLSYANLSGLSFRNADLRGAILVGTDLSHTDLSHADLSNAVLNGADLSGTNFSFASLRNASLHGATMNPSAIFTGANLDATVMPNGQFRSIR